MILVPMRQCSGTEGQEGGSQHGGDKPAQRAFAFGHENDLSPEPEVRQTQFESGQASVGGSVSGATPDPGGTDSVGARRAALVSSPTRAEAGLAKDAPTGQQLPAPLLQHGCLALSCDGFSFC